MTYQDKVKRIYEAMADKTLSFGCIVKPLGEVFTKPVIYLGTNIKKGYYGTAISEGSKHIRKDFEDLEEIGHPIHIGVVLDWVEKNTDGDKFSRLKGCRECNNYGRGASYDYFDLTQQEELKLAVMLKRKDKTKPLPLNPTKERYPVIDFITSLLYQGT